MNKMDCRDYQHLNPQFLWCEEHRKEIEKPWEEACKDFVPRLWKLDHTTKLGDLKSARRILPSKRVKIWN